ncbi:MAG TPA: hypothetical protein VL093_12865 [Flavipsychrobacter sp.]|nr:hypothetical protein [Flavipsychrobacter sp.]
MIQHTTISSLPTAAIAGTKAEAVIAKTARLSPKRRPGHHMQLMGYHMRRLGHHMQLMGHHMQRLGYHMQGLGHHMQRLGYHMQRLGHHMRRLGHHMQRLGHHMRRLGHHMQRLGDKATFFSDDLLEYGVNNASQARPRLAYCRGSPSSGAHFDNYTKHFFPHN